MKEIIRIAFDVDGTLIKKTINGDVPRYDVIAILLQFVAWGNTVFVWSGGGTDYAEMWVRKLGLPQEVRVIEKKKDTYDIDLAFDDQEADLATVTVQV